MSAGLYRTDVRTALEASGWVEDDVEGYLVAPSGALWAETTEALDSRLDSPCGTWSLAFDAGVPACVIAGAALAVTGPRESEPAPGFFQPGRTYAEPSGTTDWRFRCDSLTTHPDDGERTALGWRRFRGEWEPYAYGEGDWEIHEHVGTIDITEAGEGS